MIDLPLARWLAALALPLALPLWLGCAALAPAPPASEAGAETVVLLHGYGRSARAMRPLARRLEAQGYRVENLHYHSLGKSPAELVAELDGELAACCADAARVHFVAHSLGGIVLRAYLAEHAVPRLGRVVMLGPPNRGSELADLAQRFRVLHRLVGPTALELGTGAASLPNRLPPPDYECGVVAGSRSWNPIGSWLVRDADDGVVAVASTRLEGMADFIVLPSSHRAMLRSRRVAEQAGYFLQHGRFATSDTDG